MAVKEVQLSNIPKGELGEIMVSNIRFRPEGSFLKNFQSEIDLLKNLIVSWPTCPTLHYQQ